jgi:hypothetical protein
MAIGSLVSGYWITSAPIATSIAKTKANAASAMQVFGRFISELLETK